MILPTRHAQLGQDLGRVDVCVVGGGAAGLTLAGELGNCGATVCVVESGGVDKPGPSALNDCDVVGSHYSSPTTGRPRILGGASTVWTGWTRPMDAADFDRPNGQRWPVTFAELPPFYLRAQQELGIAAPDMPQRLDEPHAEGNLATFWMSGHRMAQRHLPLLRASPSVHLLTHHTVVALEADRASRPRRAAVNCVLAVGPDDAIARIRARTYILAAGGIENARILLDSGDQLCPPLTGRYFMEHPHVLAGLLTNVAASVPAGLVAAATDAHGASYRRVLVPAETTTGFSVLIEPMAFAWPDFPWRQRVATERTLSRVPRDGIHAVIIRAEQVPAPDNRVTLADRTLLPAGARTPVLTWSLRGRDVAAITDGMRKLHPALDQIGQLVRDPLLATDPAQLTKGGHHHMGTTRMGFTPDDGVVDSSARVFGVDNLYIAGPSVFRTGGYANPMHTTVALTLRLAHHLQHRGGQPGDP